MDQGITVSFLLFRIVFWICLEFAFWNTKNMVNLFLDMMAFRYCAVAPTILAGQIDPILFEALYVSSIFPTFYSVLEHTLSEFLSVLFFPCIFLSLSLLGYWFALKHAFQSSDLFTPFSVLWVLRLSMYKVFLMRKDLLQASQHAIFLFARIPQIWANFSVS